MRPSFSRPTDRLYSCGGFSLVELAVVVAIISLMAAFAVPSAKHLIFRTRSAAVENDLRVFASAFQAYANEHGDWPEGDGTPGAYPAGMAGYLGPTNWSRSTPLGGHYTWDPNSVQQGGRYRAVIVIASTAGNTVTGDRIQLLQLDRKFDDGDLETGNLFLGYRNSPVYVLEH